VASAARHRASSAMARCGAIMGPLLVRWRAPAVPAGRGGRLQAVPEPEKTGLGCPSGHRLGIGTAIRAARRRLAHPDKPAAAPPAAAAPCKCHALEEPCRGRVWWVRGGPPGCVAALEHQTGVHSPGVTGKTASPSRPQHIKWGAGRRSGSRRRSGVCDCSREERRNVLSGLGSAIVRWPCEPCLPPQIGLDRVQQAQETHGAGLGLPAPRHVLGGTCPPARIDKQSLNPVSPRAPAGTTGSAGAPGGGGAAKGV